MITSRLSGRRHGLRPRPRHFQPAAERMESRRLLATITVNGTGDTIANDGIITLREALTAASTNTAVGDAPAGDVGLDAINFASGLGTINLASELPSITDPVNITGADTINGIPLVMLNGGNLGFNGLTVDAAGSGSTIRGLVLNGFNNAITLNGTGNLVAGNFVGTDLSGTVAQSNGTGILVQGANNSIGGAAGTDRNIISGNTNNGISVQGANTSGTLIQGNFLGTNAAGDTALNNGLSGISLGTGATNTSIGGTTSGTGNVISSTGSGIDLGSTTGNLVQGNLIGTNSSGAIFGTSGGGILGGAAGNSTIGGTTTGSANTIANTALGTGTGAGVTTGINTGLSILGNSIFGNAGSGISGGSTGPIISSVGASNITGTFAGNPSEPYRLEFFGTADTGGASNQQGGSLLGFQDVTTDAAGNASFDFAPTGGVPTGQFITATATSANGSTSNFSAGVLASPATADLAVSITASPDPVAAGGALTHTINVTNLGQLDATNAFVTIDTPANTTFQSFVVPSGWTITQQPSVGGTGTIRATIPTLANQATGTFTLTTLVDTGVTSGTTLPSSVTVGSDTSDDDATNNVASTSTTVGVQQTGADLMITKTVQSQTVHVGEDVTYTIVVTNNGPETASSVAVTDNIPTNTTFVSATGGATPSNGVLTLAAGDLANGQTATFTVVLHPTGTAGDLVANTASAASTTTTDPDTSNNSATSTLTLQAALNPDVAVAITGSPDTAVPGQNVTYTITVTGDAGGTTTLNIPLPAETSFVSFTAPSGFTASMPSVGSNGTVTATATGTSGTQTFTLVTQVSPTAAPGTTLNTTAAVTTQGGTDPNTGNNTATVTTAVSTAADTTPPTVVDVVRYGFHTQPTLLVATFSKAMDQASASNPDNYIIQLANGRNVSVSQAFYNPDTNEVTLRSNEQIYAYQTAHLLINGDALSDTSGNLLDGDLDGNPGGLSSTPIDLNSIVGTAAEAPDAASVGVSTGGAAALAAAKKAAVARAARQAAQLKTAQAKAAKVAAQKAAQAGKLVAAKKAQATRLVAQKNKVAAQGAAATKKVSPLNANAGGVIVANSQQNQAAAFKRLIRKLSR